MTTKTQIGFEEVRGRIAAVIGSLDPAGVKNVMAHLATGHRDVSSEDAFADALAYDVTDPDGTVEPGRIEPYLRAAALPPEGFAVRFWLLSCSNHDELDEDTCLECGDPIYWAREHASGEAIPLDALPHHHREGGRYLPFIRDGDGVVRQGLKVVAPVADEPVKWGPDSYLLRNHQDRCSQD